VTWTGRPAPVVTVAPLTPADDERFAAGQAVYKGLCIGCHMDHGRGQEKVAPSLVGSRYVIGPDAGAAVRILLAGKEGSVGLMPPLGPVLNDEQIASVLTYVRREWGRMASPVDPAHVREIRELTKARNTPWTDAELTTGR
jgi:mono/diheme cytochrome c family protein